MAFKFIIICLIFYFVGLFLGWRINKAKHNYEILQLNKMWSEIITSILENNSIFDENGVFECKHSHGNMRIEKAQEGQAEAEK